MAEDHGSAVDHGVWVNDWVRGVRRARLGTSTYAVALTIASYADADGSKIYPGVARLAWECEVSYTTVKRALRLLRDAGLIERVKRGNRAAGWSDRYRLIWDPDRLTSRVTVPDPDAASAAIGEVKGQIRGESQRRYQRRRSRATGSPDSTGAAADPAAEVPSDARSHGSRVPRDRATMADDPWLAWVGGHGSRAPRESVFTGHSEADSRVTGDPPPSMSHHPPDSNPPWGIPARKTSPGSPRSGDHAEGDRKQRQRGTTGRRPWADLQTRYEAGEIDDVDIIEAIGSSIGELDAVEESTALGMLAGGSHPKAIALKIRSDRWVEQYGTCACGAVRDPDGSCGNRRCTARAA